MEQIIQIYQMYYVASRCIRAGEYYYALIDRTDDNLWRFTENFYAEIAIVRWCQLFGSSSEKTHYSKLFGEDDEDQLRWLDDAFSRNNIDKRLLSSISLTHEEYRGYWKKMKNFRESYASHWDFEQDGFDLPDIRKAITMCHEYALILKEVVAACAEKLTDIERIIELGQIELPESLAQEAAQLRLVAGTTADDEM